MSQQNRKQNILMLIGGVMMVISSGAIMASALLPISTWTVYAVKVMPWVFLIGTTTYVIIQKRQGYKGDNLTLRRLTAIQTLSGICFFLAALLIVEQYTGMLKPIVVSDMKSYFLYVRIVHNNWVVLVLIGAILQMYTTHRIASEIEKES